MPADTIVGPNHPITKLADRLFKTLDGVEMEIAGPAVINTLAILIVMNLDDAAAARKFTADIHKTLTDTVEFHLQKPSGVTTQ